MYRLYLKLFVITLFIGCSAKYSDSSLDKTVVITNSIDSILNQSKITTNSDSTRFANALKSLNISEKNRIDSLKLKSLFQLVKLSYPLKSKDSFLTWW